MLLLISVYVLLIVIGVYVDAAVVNEMGVVYYYFWCLFMLLL